MTNGVIGLKSVLKPVIGFTLLHRTRKLGNGDVPVLATVEPVMGYVVASI
jgi:hypothetical protein